VSKLQKNQCPRCGGGIPNNLERGRYIGALSRYDNETYVCSACGTDEALRQFPPFGMEELPREEWFDRQLEKAERG
jgi:DNA-directed RNA polymerase subunit RPC12/RpoP